MKCNCVTEINKKIASEQTYKGKRIEYAEIDGGFFTDKSTTPPTLSMVTTSTVYLRVEGMTKKPTINLTHQFCPFCGVKI